MGWRDRADDVGMRGIGRGRAGEAVPGRAAGVFLIAGMLAAGAMAVISDPARGWLLVGILAATNLAGIHTVRRDPRRSNPVWYLVAGSLLLLPAYTLWYPAVATWGLELGSPAITDALFLAAYASFLVALARLVRIRSATDRRVDLLDTLIVSVGLGVLVWVFLITPYLQDETMSWAARAVAISYTLVNLLLLGGVIRLLVQGGIASTGDRLLSAWVVMQLVADLAYGMNSLQGTFELSDPSVALYPVSFVLLGAALLHPSTMQPAAAGSTVHPVSGVQRLLLVIPAALVAPVVITVLAIRDRADQIPFVAFLSAVLFVLVLVRVWLLVVDVEEHRRTKAKLTASIEKERRHARENQELLASLRERQMLSDRVSRIQRKISTRAPLQEVLDAITSGAAELVHDDVAALRFIDEEDPEYMVMVSSVGVDPAVAQQVHRLPVGVGVGGRAIVTNQLCIQDSYNTWDDAIGQFSAGGLQTAMATPVHLGSEPIGSLVVATHRADRRYSRAEQEALISFAAHASIALNDARSVRAMNDALQQAVHQAMHDELTGLPNRACFYDRAEQALKGARRDRGKTAVLLFDLDRFKEINDTLGHRYGDRVLCAIGPRIAPLLRDADTLARLGGDEFCVLLPSVPSVEVAVEVARRITLALEEPVEVDGMTLVVEASCGVAVAPDHGDTADLMLQRSDVAMYVAKTSHASVALYEDRLDRNTPDRLTLLGELRTAVGGDELVMHYQPQIDLRSGSVQGVEALVRWRHPRRGLLAPDVFLPIAEETGLIHQLTSWVLDASLQQLRAWLDDPDLRVGRDFTMAVNLSTHSLLDDSFVTEVRVALERFGIPADQLVLEITETTLMADPTRAQRVLTQLADNGVRFAIDDFGTGYSSLAALKGLPVHDLKIDKSFVRCMDRDIDDAIIVRSVIELGHTLGLRTVAEGVENQAVRDRLSALGCDSAQGYAFAPPMPPDELFRWMREEPFESPAVLFG